MLWDNKAPRTKSQDLFKGIHNARIGSHATLEENRFGKRFPFTKVGYKISGKGVAKT